jgi:hypothetical protein
MGMQSVILLVIAGNFACATLIPYLAMTGA